MRAVVVVDLQGLLGIAGGVSLGADVSPSCWLCRVIRDLNTGSVRMAAIVPWSRYGSMLGRVTVLEAAVVAMLSGPL